MGSLRVVGVDVEPGCRSSGGKCFSVAVVEGGRLVAKHEGVPLHRLIRLLWEYRPSILALDNVMELARSKRELLRVLSLIPPETMVIQPTRLPDGSLVDLRRLARLAGLDPGSGKLSPSKTAYYAALLAEMGYGTPLRFVEEKTRIVVARSRRLKHGGMSARRYQRRVRAAILRAVRDIKRALDRSRLDYDLMFRKSGGGLDSAVFIVYAPRSRLNGIVRPHEDLDVRITIEPIYRSEISFETPLLPEEPGSKPYLIVGVDPGISTGVAAVDLDGNPVLAVSRRGLDRTEVIELIRQYGVPILVATDVTPAPDFVRKLASMLRIPVYEPPSSLSVEEKRAIFEDYASRYPMLRRVADSHVRDALAAAVKAFHAYESKLRQIESYIARLDLDIDVEKVKADVIRGVSIAEAVEQAINKLLVEEEEAVERPEKKPTPSKHGGRGEAETIEALRAENYALRRRVRELEEELRLLETEMRLLTISYREGLEKEREVATLRNRLEALRSELEKTRAQQREAEEAAEKAEHYLYRIAAGQAIPAPILADLGRDHVEQLEQLAKTLGRMVVLVESFNPVLWEKHSSKLSRLAIALLVPSQQLEAARKAVEHSLLPVLPAEHYVLDRVGSTAVVDPRVVVEAYERLQLLREEKARREKRREMSVADLKRMLLEYRAKRAKMLLGD